MSRPKHPGRHRAPTYPTLAEFSRDRRRFLEGLGFGAIALGLGGRYLSGCTLGEATSGDMAIPDYYDVRLPESGFTSAYIGSDNYLYYAISMVVYEEAFTEYLARNSAAVLQVASQALQGKSCDALTGGTGHDQILKDLQSALEQHYHEQTDGNDGALIHSLNLLVDACEYEGGVDGDMPAPDYP